LPRWEKSSRALAMTTASCATPIAAKTGVASLEVGAGLAVCAARQIVQDVASFWLEWMWVDSAATVHNKRQMHSIAGQRIHERMNVPTQIRLI
jgi:hypothetical protein